MNDWARFKVRTQPQDPVGFWPSLTAFLFFVAAWIFAMALAAGALAGCSVCALPHEDVQVLANDAERLAKLWTIEHSHVGLTESELADTRQLVGRVLERSALAKQGLRVEGKAIKAAETERGGLK